MYARYNYMLHIYIQYINKISSDGSTTVIKIRQADNTVCGKSHLHLPFHSRTTEVHGDVTEPCSQRLHLSVQVETEPPSDRSLPTLTV